MRALTRVAPAASARLRARARRRCARALWRSWAAAESCPPPPPGQPARHPRKERLHDRLAGMQRARAAAARGRGKPRRWRAGALPVESAPRCSDASWAFTPLSWCRAWCTSGSFGPWTRGAQGLPRARCSERRGYGMVGGICWRPGSTEARLSRWQAAYRHSGLPLHPPLHRGWGWKWLLFFYAQASRAPLGSQSQQSQSPQE
jgi:hypothetical protein